MVVCLILPKKCNSTLGLKKEKVKENAFNKVRDVRDQLYLDLYQTFRALFLAEITPDFPQREISMCHRADLSFSMRFSQAQNI